MEEVRLVSEHNNQAVGARQHKQSTVRKGGGGEGRGEGELLLILGFRLVWYTVIQQSTRVGTTKDKQSTRLDKEEGGGGGGGEV